MEQLLLLLLFLSLLVFMPNTLPSLLVRANPPLAKHGCSESCGGVTIPFPYGIEPGCFLNDWFEIDCRNGSSSSNSSKPFLKKIHSEVLTISLPNTMLDQGGTIRVIIPAVSTANCSDGGNRSLSLEGSSFIFSQEKNVFTVVGCNVLALLNSSASGCGPLNFSHGSCQTGSSCCQRGLLSGQQDFNVEFKEVDEGQCAYAFLADPSWVASKYSDLHSVGAGPRHVQAVLQWGIPDGSDPVLGSKKQYCGVYVSKSGYNTSLYQCYCSGGYYGNGYLENGCEDIDECMGLPSNGSLCPNNLQCVNEPGGFRCTDHWFPMLVYEYSAHHPFQQSALGALVLMLCIWISYKFINKRRAILLRKKYYERNGGLLLQQQIKSPEGGSLEGNRIFSSKELEVATDNFNPSRVLGRGGQGAVYKGMLADGRIVAIKKSMVVDEEKLEQFINEVVILSKINHRNIVRLLGCCLETQVPLLVYEFIPNGTLLEYLQDPSEGIPVTWETRLRISVEISGALAYLHSAASIPIYHRDIKSTNILLDDKYRAKVADFGTSKPVSLEQTHVTTLVRGTFGYLDPEYFQSSQFTDKSDVYSFGVVLVELLTGQKPISSTREEEGRSLSTYFTMSMEENLLFDILDTQVKEQGTEEEISRVAHLARRCLHLHGRNRPTMKEVAAELEEVGNIEFPLPSGYDGITNEQHADCLAPGGSSPVSMTLMSPNELPLMVTSYNELVMLHLQSRQQSHPPPTAICYR